MTLMMTSGEVVETSVNVTNNSPSRDYSHPVKPHKANYNVAMATFFLHCQNGVHGRDMSLMYLIANQMVYTPEIRESKARESI